MPSQSPHTKKNIHRIAHYLASIGAVKDFKHTFTRVNDGTYIINAQTTQKMSACLPSRIVALQITRGLKDWRPHQDLSQPVEQSDIFIWHIFRLMYTHSSNNGEAPSDFLARVSYIFVDSDVDWLRRAISIHYD
ncbi:MAG: hypothetical protein EBQ92_12005 [Proteobacteria bacterium]|nr:hypothetical protein [Pseudomonadota bacterium]